MTPVIPFLSADSLTDMPEHCVLVGKFFQAPVTMRENSGTLATMGKTSLLSLLSLLFDGAVVVYVCFRDAESFLGER